MQISGGGEHQIRRYSMFDSLVNIATVHRLPGSLAQMLQRAYIAGGQARWFSQAWASQSPPSSQF